MDVLGSGFSELIHTVLLVKVLLDETGIYHAWDIQEAASNRFHATGIIIEAGERIISFVIALFAIRVNWAIFLIQNGKVRCSRDTSMELLPGL